MTLHEVHLSNDQIDDVLIGEAAADITAHVAGCADCRERVALAGAPLASFAAVTLAWSERQSATMTPAPVGTDGSAFRRANHKLNWALAAVLLAVVGFLLPMATRETPGGTSLGASSDAQGAGGRGEGQKGADAMTKRVGQTDGAEHGPKMMPMTAGASKEQLAQDNQMLEAIDDELDASVRSPADTFELSGSEGKTSGGHGQGVPEPVMD